MSEHGVKSLPPQQAWQMLQDDPQAILVDIRSTMEYLFVGHPADALHVPWVDEPDWMVNPDFETEIRKLLPGGDASPGAPVILICRSGRRSLDAGKVLLEGGLRDIFHIDEGFEGELDEHHHRSTTGGWRFRGLPWGQC
ncbi:MAG: Rhodanese-related sulfurtransferase [Olavius algarvensis Gamma 1 endosymbiont]|nr:MAG: Rhodanese-related sulfurtransferase [Olavius algarvensis Gamma 1 endosymbiont]